MLYMVYAGFDGHLQREEEVQPEEKEGCQTKGEVRLEEREGKEDEEVVEARWVEEVGRDIELE